MQPCVVVCIDVMHKYALNYKVLTFVPQTEWSKTHVYGPYCLSQSRVKANFADLSVRKSVCLLVGDWWFLSLDTLVSFIIPELTTLI